MKILFLTQVLPYPLDAGPKIRAHYVLRYLAEAGADIVLVSFVRIYDRTTNLTHLRSLCRQIHTVPMNRSPLRDAWHGLRSLATGIPFLISRDQVAEMDRTLQRVLTQNSGFDVVHADQLWMAPYALRCKYTDNRMKTILDQHNAVFQIPGRLARQETNPLKRWLLSREAHQLIRYESHTVSRFDRVVWVSRADCQALLEANGKIEPRPADSFIPICVDPTEIRPLEPSQNPMRVTFLGGMHWPPNSEGVRWLVQEVWPKIAQKEPGARLTVIGKNPPRMYAGSAASQSIEFTGYLEDLTDYLSETAVFVVPLLSGGGMRVKILDAWCRGLPVVSTRIGAEGLEVDDGHNVLLADSAESFAHAVLGLLSSPSRAASIARGGRKTVETKYSWRRVYQAWEKVYQCVSSS